MYVATAIFSKNKRIRTWPFFDTVCLPFTKYQKKRTPANSSQAHAY